MIPLDAPKVYRRLRLGLGWALSLGMLATVSTCSPRIPLLERVRATGTLQVATLNSPTTYYVGPAGPTGFEYDLAKGFADWLGVRLDLQVMDTPADVMAEVEAGHAHLGAAGLAVTPERRKRVHFSRPVHAVEMQLVYRMGADKPADLAALSGRLVVPTAGSAAELLQSLRARYPNLRWEGTGDYGAEELLYRVANGEIDYTIATSDLIAIDQRYYPQLRVAFPVASAQDLAWAFAYGDDSLYQATADYLKDLGETELARLRDRYFGHITRVDYIGAVTLASDAQRRLPRYRALFEDAANHAGLDWRLLAAVGYQESHWEPDAISPTGVRGIMQLTTDTAVLLDVADRADPKLSIYGAARYLQQLLSGLPPDIKEPDRTWLALAAYNMGLGHLFDVQNITRKLGGDPNRWVDLRKNLPLLTQPKWYRDTRHGYARGLEALAYVDNIRAYYDMLLWITGGVRQPEPEPSSAPPPKQKPREHHDPLDINSPVG